LPLIAGVAAAAILVLSLGAVGIAIYLRYQRVELATKTHRAEDVSATAFPPAPSGGLPEAPKKPGPGTSSAVTPVPVVDGPRIDKPISDAPLKSGELEPPVATRIEILPEVVDRPDKKGPQTLAFYNIPLSDVDTSNGGKLPSIATDGPVSKLELIGGDDRELQPYRFALAKDENNSSYYNVNEGEQGSRRAGNFEVKEKEISFKWEVPTGPPDADMRNRLCDCVLAVTLEDGSRSYHLLREPKVRTSLPNPIAELPAKAPEVARDHSNKEFVDLWKKERWGFAISWCGASDEVQGSSPWTCRTLSLREMRMTMSGKPVDLKHGPSENRYVVEAEPKPAELSIGLRSDFPGKLYFVANPRTRSDVELKNWRAGTKKVKDRADFLKRQVDGFQNDPQIQQMQSIPDMQQAAPLVQLRQARQELQDANAELLKRQETDELEKQWRTSLKELLTAHLEVWVTLKAGGHEFTLAKLESGNNRDNQEIGAKQ
jgi:hypothetical protein